MIWWCVQHNAESANSLDPAEDQLCCWLYADADMEGVDKPDGPCRMVEALLIVKENGRWPERAVIKVAGTLYTNAGGSGLLWDDNYRPKLTPIAKHILDALASVGGDSQ